MKRALGDTPKGIVDSFLLQVRVIGAAKGERDLRSPLSVHVDKPPGKKSELTQCL